MPWRTCRWANPTWRQALLKAIVLLAPMQPDVATAAPVPVPSGAVADAAAAMDRWRKTNALGQTWPALLAQAQANRDQAQANRDILAQAQANGDHALANSEQAQANHTTLRPQRCCRSCGRSTTLVHAPPTPISFSAGKAAPRMR